jgi:hypothetical protein
MEGLRWQVYAVYGAISIAVGSVVGYFYGVWWGVGASLAAFFLLPLAFFVFWIILMGTQKH